MPVVSAVLSCATNCLGLLVSTVVPNSLKDERMRSIGNAATIIAINESAYRWLRAYSPPDTLSKILFLAPAVFTTAVMSMVHNKEAGMFLLHENGSKVVAIALVGGALIAASANNVEGLEHLITSIATFVISFFLSHRPTTQEEAKIIA